MESTLLAFVAYKAGNRQEKNKTKRKPHFPMLEKL